MFLATYYAVLIGRSLFISALKVILSSCEDSSPSTAQYMFEKHSLMMEVWEANDLV